MAIDAGNNLDLNEMETPFVGKYYVWCFHLSVSMISLQSFCFVLLTANCTYMLLLVLSLPLS